LVYLCVAREGIMLAASAAEGRSESGWAGEGSLHAAKAKYKEMKK